MDSGNEFMLLNPIIIRGPKLVRMASYGANCERCRVYFVTHDRADQMCPWCRRVAAGISQPELYEAPEDLLSPSSESSPVAQEAESISPTNERPERGSPGQSAGPALGQYRPPRSARDDGEVPDPEREPEDQVGTGL